MSPIGVADLYLFMGSLRRRPLVWALAIILLVVVAGVALTQRLPLVSDQPPGRLETAIARRLVVLSVPRSAREQRNPLSGNGDAWREGAEHFQDHCALCHGRDGRGGTGMAKMMYPPVPDLTDPAIQGMSDGALFAVIQNGVRWTGMPAFRQEHNAEETWRLVSFIRRIPTLAPNEFVPRADHPHEAEPEHEHDAASGGGSGTTITMDGTAFAPAQVTVALGETVTWVNKDPFPHNVTAVQRMFRSSDLPSGARWTFTPKSTGRFDYRCTLHPGMHGTLVVEQKATKKES